MKLALLATAAIKANIELCGKKGAEFALLVHETAVQTVLHAQQHGDCTLADDLVKTIRESTPGYVWQGLVKWYRTYSPIAWDAEGKVYLLKPDEKGYKPFDPESAEAKPAANDASVTARTDTRIEPFSIGLIKKRIVGMKAQLEKATAEGGRGIVGDKATIETFLNAVIAFGDKVAVMPDASGEAGKKDTMDAEEGARKVA